ATMFFDDPAAEKIYANNMSGTPADHAALQRQMRYHYRMQTQPEKVGTTGSSKSAPRLPTLCMDETFFPMDTGTQNVLQIKMPPWKYFNLVYTGGWRLHPPRAQAMENAQKRMPANDPKDPDKTISIVQPERDAFASNDPNFDPISKLSDFAPARRMLRAFEGA